MLRKSSKPTFSPSRQRPKVRPLGATARCASTPKPSRSGSTDATAVKMTVCVRIRPKNERERGENSRDVVLPIDAKMLVFDPREPEDAFFYRGVQQPTPGYLKRANKEMQFVFDRVFDESASNRDVFEASTRDVVASMMDGYNCSVFVYGATGAGKTHTMLGADDSPGITYLTMRELFDTIENHRADREFDICVSYLEIYNENVYDLLQPSGPLYLREDSKFGVQVAGLNTKSITTAQELLDMLDRGNKNRTQHPTDANAESSRSHAVFQVYVKMRTKATNQARIVKLSMIDLAGSERAAATGCKGDRFKEGANINRSLLALGNCINQLADGSKFIPYRDSKLTRLLKDSLGGNCRTVMIANIAPTNISYDDTYNTLKYATRANKIQQRMKQNIISCDGHIAQYIKQIEELNARVKQLEGELMTAKEKGNNPQIIMNDVEDSETKKWRVLLESKARSYFEILTGILKKQRKQRCLAARAARKYRAAMALTVLCGDVSDLQLRDACSKDISRLTLASDNLIKQTELSGDDLQSLSEKLQCSKDEYMTLCNNGKIMQNDFSNCFVSGLNYKEKYFIAQAESEHLHTIANIQQDEINKVYSFVKNSLKTLKKNYLRLKSQGMFTSAMYEEYNDLIRQAKNSRAVTWEDNHESEECDDDYFKFIINLNPTLNLPPKMIKETDLLNFNVDHIEKMPLLESTLNREDTIILDDSELHSVVDDKKNATITSVLADIKLLKTFTPVVKPIDATLLNSTFNLTDCLEGEPTAKKICQKPKEENKKLLIERTNLILNEKSTPQQNKPILNKVIFKKPLPVINKENRSGFGSSSDRFQNSINKTGCKTIRGKERVGLAAATVPYNKNRRQN